MKGIHRGERYVGGDKLKVNHRDIDNRGKTEVGSCDDASTFTDVQDMCDALIAEHGRTFRSSELALSNAFGDPVNAMLHAGIEIRVFIHVNSRPDNIFLAANVSQSLETSREVGANSVRFSGNYRRWKAGLQVETLSVARPG